ncbi:UPF0489 family protein [Chitinophaga nivalis]|uniref:UPF0489 family protein n=1 Tax=Chitinophaga nivalis TaxID=2991709 RepID=A0ABT3IPB3_9BACT|nr:UPF0489 family protein [Chitinophaga nivalis]MCW3464497.1 UPF0489 family protein [Chitinophaga nivalis]MCW3485812.1 UPF0489 family protein [Chitinophaga nivalis]
MSTPLFIVEEHHEAFIAWAYAFQQGIISGPCQLLHFDDHSDLNTPVFHTSINHLLQQPLQAIRELVYDEMRIDTFILPAAYLGLISDVVWIRQDMPMPLDTLMYIRSFNGDGKKITAGKINPGNNTPGLQLMQYAKIATPGFDTYAIKPNTDILLDIDLDYFSCQEDPYSNNEVIIEITASEYHDFIGNKYHYLRYLVNSIKAVQKNDDFFYIINHFPDSYPSNREVTAVEITKRIDLFAESLQAKGIRPTMITVCKSGHSGFTPPHQVDSILQQVLDKLNGLYDVQLTDVIHTPHPTC